MRLESIMTVDRACELYEKLKPFWGILLGVIRWMPVLKERECAQWDQWQRLTFAEFMSHYKIKLSEVI